MLRVQKFLTQIGLISRRKCEKLIDAKQIKINGKYAKLGDKVTYNDVVNIFGKEIRFTESTLSKKTLTIAYHKRIGEIVSRKSSNVINTVFENLPKVDQRWLNVGRLDVATSGLILFTNNGFLANKLMHPSSEIKRVYLVETNKAITNNHKDMMLDNVDIGNNEIGKFYKIWANKKRKNQYKLSLYTGKNREIRRVFNRLGYKIKSLKRISYGPVNIDNIKLGSHRYLSDSESKLILN